MDNPKKTEKELREIIRNCGPRMGSLWVHYKYGTVYCVFGSCINEATQEVMVMYGRYSEDTLWGQTAVPFTRPLREWHATVQPEINGPYKQRFSPFGNDFTGR